jgi:hypothetical protein
MPHPVKNGDKKGLPGVHEAAKNKKLAPEQKEKARSEKRAERRAKNQIPPQ